VARVPPHDLEAEKAVLSALLLDNASIHAVYTELKPDDFYHPVHRQLYASMLALTQDNQPVDLHTLADRLNTQKQLDAVGGPVFLAELADYEATAANVVHHARIVRDKAVKRRLIATATEIVDLGFDEGDRADALLDRAESRIFEISSAQARNTFRTLDEEVHRAFDFIDALRERGAGLTGVTTGFLDLDKLTGGLQRGELVIVAARPSMGKTSFALDLARNAATSGYKVWISSLEMSSLTLRLLSSQGGVDANVFRNGYFTEHAYKSLQLAANQLTNLPVVIDDSSALTILELKSKCRRARAERGLDLVVVDYLQLMRGDSRPDNREQEIAEISRGLKSLAKELEVPVIALAQLNRGPETREEKRPRLADLRESGAIEQDADLIAFLYRDEVYNKSPEAANTGLAEVIVAKQRNGPTGTVNLTFEARFARFRDYSNRTNEPTSAVGGSFVATGEGGDPDGADVF